MEEALPPTNQVQQAPPVEKPPEAKPIMPPKPKTPLLVVSIVLILALIGAMGYLAYQNYQLKQQISQLQTSPSSSPTPIPTEDPTTNWETYTNSDKGITFKIPSLESIIEVTAQYDLYLNGPNFTISSIDIFQKGKSITCEQSENIKPCLIEGFNWKQEKNIQSIVIDEHNALNYYIWNEENLVINVIEFESPFLQMATPVDGPGLKERFDQILSTFEFLDPEESIETQIRSFINQYMETIISEDWEKFKDYLTQSIQEEFVETSAPIGISSYNILSIEGPNQQNQYTATVQMFDNNDSILKQPPGTDPQILILQEEGEWKSLTWYIFP